MSQNVVGRFEGLFKCLSKLARAESLALRKKTFEALLQFVNSGWFCSSRLVPRGGGCDAQCWWTPADPIRTDLVTADDKSGFLRECGTVLTVNAEKVEQFRQMHDSFKVGPISVGWVALKGSLNGALF